MNIHSLSMNQAELNVVGRDQNTINNFTSVYYDAQAGRERSDIAEWLSPLNFKASQSGFLQTREEGTGNWLLESQTFRDWCNGTSSRILWCPGDPGAGKTILTSIIVDLLQTLFENSDVGIAFMYCNYQEQTTQTVANLIASLLKQFVQNSRTVSDNTRSFYDRHRGQRTYPTLDEFIKALEVEIKSYTQVFIVVDALDECSEVNGTRMKLIRVLRSLPRSVNLMVTSRDLASIKQEFLDAGRLRIRAHDEDITKYVENQLGGYSDLTKLRADITKIIIDKARGMFLLARLHMNTLLQQCSEKEVLDALENLPDDIDDIYNDAMVRIERQPPRDKELAKKILSWITYARRPLSVVELQHALSVSFKMTEMDPRSLIFAWKLTSVCAGLVVIDEEQCIIRLAHYTTQQYFERHRESLFPNAEATVAATCLTYLTFDVFGCGSCKDDEQFESLLKCNPLLDYAARNWGHHARPHQTTLENSLLNFVSDDAKVACASQFMLVPSRRRASPTLYFRPNFLGMHSAAYFGLEHIVRVHLENGADVNSIDGHDRTPLSYSAEFGHERVVKLLLTHDNIDADLPDVHRRTPLSHAAQRGCEEVVKMLLMHRQVDANAKDSDGQTPLSYAAEHGYEGVVKLLVLYDNIDVNSKDGRGRTPMSYAAGNGHEEVVNLLLAHPNLNTVWRDGRGRTPFFHATENGHDKVINLLLTHGKIDCFTYDGPCPYDLL